MIISYYIKNDKSLMENNDYQAFKAIHENSFLKDHYKNLKGFEIQTHIFALDEGLKPFIKNEKIMDVLRELDFNGLPIVIVDNNIEKIGSIFSSEELSSLLDLGISFQYEEQPPSD